MIKYILFFSLFTVWACTYYEDSFFPKGDVEGYKPVYATIKDYEIEWRQPVAIKKPGKIYVYNNLLLINDKFTGIHLIDNRDPSHPQPIGFLSIPGNIDMAMKNNVLYADNQRDLVAIDLLNPSHPDVVKRFENMLPEYNLFPHERGFFECVDTTKGIVVGWEKTTIKNPKCYR